ncbi:hypothetical protein KR100_00235 [Synechococcus sp. KORDI-100]|uniref:hypothetical protein n=1 Tax=Synechococcus sp. KORDI-100 TaxID=1280380 RepID=UPI0004E05B8D|nr:hypothetical protein [Synechococcus sp. KORDI-100]AII41837.1 hypothetical protein KR100_00235 [Synechococcus sp. KORDI-100]
MDYGFTATTRQVLAALGFSDPKTLHRRREDYRDGSNPVCDSQKIFQAGVHFVRVSPSPYAPIRWDLAKTLRAWKAATMCLAFESLQDRAAETARREMEDDQ